MLMIMIQIKQDINEIFAKNRYKGSIKYYCTYASRWICPLPSASKILKAFTIVVSSSVPNHYFFKDYSDFI